MKVLFSGQIPKELPYPDDSEDMVEVAEDNSKVVLSDGASESFDSKTWARIITSSFISELDLSQDWLNEAISQYEACFDLANLSWSKQAAFARGSFGTLLAIDQRDGADTARVIGVGDSLAVFLDGEKLLESFPYTEATEFEQHPELISTNPSLNGFMASEEFPARYQKSWSLKDKKHPIVLFMTDALGAWALRHGQDGDPKWQQLAQIRDLAELERLVVQEREAKTLRIDDTTLVCISLRNIEPEKDELPES